MWCDALFTAMDATRKIVFGWLQGKNLNFGSDCSGADAAVTSAKIWSVSAGATVSNKMSSEAPGADGPMLYLLLNHAPTMLFCDVLARGHSGFDMITGMLQPVPSDLDFYSAGTMCTDFSNFNTLSPKLHLGFLL